MFTSLSYFAAQIATITALALMGLTFLVSNPKNINARLFAVICLSTITYIVATMQYQSNPEFHIDLSAYWLPLQIMMNMGAGCVMILCYSLFQDSKRIPLWVVGIFSLQILLSALRPLFVSNNVNEIDIETIGAINYFVFGSLPILLQSLFVIIGGYWIIKGWQADVVEYRRVLRWLFLGTLFLLLFAGIISELFLVNANAQQQVTISVYKTFGRMTIVFIGALLCLRFESVFEKVTSSIPHDKVVKSTDTTKADLETFFRIFRDQKVYLQPGLSIAELAKKLAIPQYKLRHLVNKELGYRNFNALLNDYRVKDACQQLSNPKENSTPVLTIALTVGYQSIAPFNQAFRELMGTTPTDFRKQSQYADIASSPVNPPLPAK